jgi:hypothetical protein
MSEGSANKIRRHINHIKADLKRYIEKRLQLLTLKAGEQGTRLIAELAQKIGGVVLLFCALIFWLIALALYLGTLLSSNSLGFLASSGVFFFIGLLLVLLKPKFLTRKLQSGLVEGVVKISITGDSKQDEEENTAESNVLTQETNT